LKVNTINKDLKNTMTADAQIALGIIGFLIFSTLIVAINYSRNIATENEKQHKQISILQHEITVLRGTVRSDIIDREGQLPYNQVASHMKSLGL